MNNIPHYGILLHCRIVVVTLPPHTTLTFSCFHPIFAPAYKERWRDRPDDTLATSSNRYTYGANSCSDDECRRDI